MAEELGKLERVGKAVSQWAGIKYFMVAIEGLPALLSGDVGGEEVEGDVALASDIVSRVESFEDVDVGMITLRGRGGVTLVRSLPNRFMILIKGSEEAVMRADEVVMRVLSGGVTKCGKCGATLEYLNINCPNCGSVIPATAQRCHACGKAVGSRNCPNCGARVRYDGEPIALNRRRLVGGIIISVIAGAITALAGHALGVGAPVTGFMGSVVGLTGAVTSYLMSLPAT